MVAETGPEWIGWERAAS